MAGLDTGAMGKLAKDIGELSEASWQKTREYVDKLRQIDRLDAAAEKEASPIGRLSGPQREDLGQFLDAFKTLARSYAKEEIEKKAAERKKVCAFCRKKQEEARKFVVGPDAGICDECIELCMEIIEDDAPEKMRDAAAKLLGQTFPLEKHRTLWKTMARKSKRIVDDWKEQRGSGIDPLDFLDKYKGAIMTVVLKEEHPIRRHCYCCEFAYDADKQDYDCEFCPLKAGYRCIEKGSPFKKMITAMKRLSEKKFKQYALEVADSPVAPFVKVKG